MFSQRRSALPEGKSRCRQARTYFLQVRRTRMFTRQPGRLAGLPACIREWRPSIGKGLTSPSIPLCPLRASGTNGKIPVAFLRENSRDGLRIQSAKIVVRAVRCADSLFFRLDKEFWTVRTCPNRTGFRTHDKKGVPHNLRRTFFFTHQRLLLD